MIQLFGAIVRGLRSRALLSAGSVLLTALAIGSAVLAAAAVVLVGGRARAVRAATTRPSLLRDEEGR